VWLGRVGESSSRAGEPQTKNTSFMQFAILATQQHEWAHRIPWILNPPNPRIPDSPLAAVVGFVLAFLSKAILHFLWLGLLINSAKLCIFSSFSRQHFPARLFHSHHLVFSAALCADFNTFRNFRVGHEIGRGQRARGIGTGTGTVKQAQPTNCIRVEFWQQHLLLLSHLHFLLWHFNENLNN